MNGSADVFLEPGPVLAGVVFAVGLAGAGWATRFDQDRSFYPVVLVVIALLYVLFGMEDGRVGVLMVETTVAAAFVAVAITAHHVGAGWGTALLAAGLALHAGWDVGRGAFLPPSDAVPPWWPPFCLGVDLTLAAFVAARWPPPPAAAERR